MLSQFKDYYFWFAQPPTILTQTDKAIGYIFLGLVVLGIVLGFWGRFAKPGVNKKLLRKFFSVIFTTGVSGLIWFGLRFENTYIFSQRYWAAITVIIGLVWLVFVLKYLVFRYRKEKVEFDKELVKSKYLP